jgi:thiol:disulfide interchange protein
LGVVASHCLNMKFIPLLLAFLCLNLPAIAEGFSLNLPRLTVEVVSEASSIAADKPFTVGVKMKHIEHGHSYWLNPGGPGKATKFTWTLPPGFTAGEPQWPAPIVAESATFLSYLYEGEIMPLVTITPPDTIKPGETIRLDLMINALVCIDDCLPQNVSAILKVAVAEAPVASDAATQAAFAKARAALPVAPKSWTFSAANQADSFVITLKPSAGANAKLKHAYFFSAAADPQVTDPSKPQVLAQVGDHWTLTIPRAEASLQGILQTNDGWLEGESKVNAFEVDLPVGRSAQEASAATSNPEVAGQATAPIPAAGQEQYGTLTLLLFAFIGGLILNVMPCVFPVIGIKIMGFVQQAGEDKRKIVMHGLAYTAGVLVCFWALALFVIIAGKGWGSQLQSPLFVFGLCYFFLAFGLNMAGVFEFGTSVMGVGQELQSKSGMGGTFFQGLLATVVATPCSAPFLAPALAWAVSLPPLMALAVFTVIGLGLASPYLLLSFAPGLVKLMPRPGAWMESFKQAMSFLLFGTAGYMLWVLTGMVEQWNVLMTILGLVLLALACWIYGRWFLPHKSARARSLGLIFTALALLGGLWLGWPTDLKPTSAEASATDGSQLKWQAWSPELVKELRAANKPVYIDFTALWCATCQWNKRQYKNDTIKALIKEKRVELLKADYTNYDARILKVLTEDYHRAAVPVNVLYVPGSTEAIILPPALTEANLTEAFQQIK